MATTIPALSSVSDILDTDLIMVTHSTGDSYKMSGADFNKRNQVVIAPDATPTTLTGAPLKIGNVVRVYWKVALTANSASTVLSLSYNGVSYTVKVPRNGSLVNFTPFDLGSGVYEYLQPYTTLELLFDGTQFVIMGNDVLISTSDYSIYTDGIKRESTVAQYSKNIPTSAAVRAYLENFQAKNYILGLTDANVVANNIADMYRVSQNTENLPVNRIGLLKSYKYISGQHIRITQIYYTNDENINNGKVFIRWGQSSNYETGLTWGSWKELQLT